MYLQLFNTFSNFQDNWEHEVYLDPQFSFHVSNDGHTPVYQEYHDKIWHQGYYDTDPLFKLIKEKEKTKSFTKRKFNRNDMKKKPKVSIGKKNGGQKTFDNDITKRQRYFLELLTRHFYKNGFIPQKSNFSSDTEVRINNYWMLYCCYIF